MLHTSIWRGCFGKPEPVITPTVTWYKAEIARLKAEIIKLQTSVDCPVCRARREKEAERVRKWRERQGR
jgi:hypothetical protein